MTSSPIPGLDLDLSEYSEKSIVLRGEKTREMKEDLKVIGGKYNSKLKGGPGWIFPSRIRTKVEDYLKTGVIEIQSPSSLSLNQDELITLVKNLEMRVKTLEKSF